MFGYFDVLVYTAVDMHSKCTVVLATVLLDHGA